jgi:hypothetical protein
VAPAPAEARNRAVTALVAVVVWPGQARTQSLPRYSWPARQWHSMGHSRRLAGLAARDVTIMRRVRTLFLAPNGPFRATANQDAEGFAAHGPVS